MKKKKKTSERVKSLKTKSKRQNNAATYTAKIKVVGIGGGGGNAVSRMVDRLMVRGAELTAVNTDAQDLDFCFARRKILIGKNIARGLGTGMNPDLGRQAAEESRGELVELTRGADLIFLTACFGGGTGSSVLPYLADITREAGILTIAVITKPFTFEGVQRMQIAEEAITKLRDKVDTLIVIPNDRIFSIIKKETPLLKAFEHIDDVLRSAIQGLAELIATPGIINLDFADVRAIMKDAGPALVGIGLGSGQDRGAQAVKQVVSSPLLEASLDGSKRVLFGVAGNRDLKMNEINDVAKVIASAVDPGAKIIFGAYHDRKLKQGQIKVTLVATGFGTQMPRKSNHISSLFDSSSQEVLVRSQDEVSGEKASEKIGDNSKGEKRGDADNSVPQEDMWEIPAFLRKKKRK